MASSYAAAVTFACATNAAEGAKERFSWAALSKVCEGTLHYGEPGG